VCPLDLSNLDAVMTTDTFRRPAAIVRRRADVRWRRAVAALAFVALLGGMLDGLLYGDGGAVRGGERGAVLRLPSLGVPWPLHSGRGAGGRFAGREQRAVERVRSYTPFVSAGGRRGRLVALTFDDGPGPYTHRLVRVLRARHVPATFFQVGQMVSAFPGAARAVERRFPVGDHTLSHAPMGLLARRAQVGEVLAGAERLRIVERARRPVLFRPPYASFDAATLSVLRRERMLMVLWDVDSEDYTRPGVRAIVRNVVSRVRPGSIVLMHDAGGDRSQTVAAVPLVVRALRRRGFRFVTVPRMMLAAPPAHRQKLPPGAGR
jgi:peptidoglycan/xylan/chitin deacetylase (PgdA/CDA1 family)